MITHEHKETEGVEQDFREAMRRRFDISKIQGILKTCQTATLFATQYNHSTSVYLGRSKECTFFYLIISSLQ